MIMPRRRRTQQCTKCQQPSLPGIKQGHGKCRYHWLAGIYGIEWANWCRDCDILNSLPDDFATVVTTEHVRAAHSVLKNQQAQYHTDIKDLAHKILAIYEKENTQS